MSLKNKVSKSVLLGVLSTSFLVGSSLFAEEKKTSVKVPEFKPGEFVIKFKDNNFSVKNLAILESKMSGKIIKKIPNSPIVVLKRTGVTAMSESVTNVINQLRANPDIEIVEPNYIYRLNKTPDDPKYKELWGLHNVGQESTKGKKGVEGVDIGAEQAWDLQTGSENIVVGVIDTGVDYNLEDLKANMWKNENEANGIKGVDDDDNGFVDDIYGYDFANKDGDPLDDHGHGSHVSGTIGASGNDGKGLVGVAWNVKIMALKFLTKEGSGSLDDAVEAVKYATKMGAHLTSNSWGGGGVSEILKQAIEEASAKNIAFIAAAGNDSLNLDQEPSYPASYKVANVIAVSAIDNKGLLASFSSFGKKSVHVAAPGVDIVSTTPTGYNSWSGTSMATPHVSGIAALLLSSEPLLTPSDIKDRLISTSKPLSSLKGRVASNGLVNAYNALANITAPPDLDDPVNWSNQFAVEISSPHPYGKLYTGTWEVEAPAEATEMALHFSTFSTEARYDKITFYNREGIKISEMSGEVGEGWSELFPGNYVKIVFTSDNSVQKNGFDIDKAAWRIK